MQAKWAASVCSVVLVLGLGAIGQESGSSNDPILKTRPNDRNTPPDDRNAPAPQQGPGAAYPGHGNPSSTYGAPPNAIMPIYQMTKLNETKRQKIMNDPALSPQQKSEEINAIYQEQQRSIQQIAAEAKGK